MGISVVQQLQSTGPAPAPPQADAGSDGEENSLTFDDLVDVINPLHHLPVVSTIYRAVTGDEISNHARAIGGGLYGGPIGLLAAGATMAAEEAMGLTTSASLASFFSGEEDAAEVAAAAPARSAKVAEQAQASSAPVIAQQAAPIAAQQTLPFTARGGPKFYTMPSQQRSYPLPSPQAPAAAAPAQASQAQTNGLALTRTEGDLLDAFIRRNGAPQNGQAQPVQQQPAHASAALRPAGPPANADSAWFANKMEANLQKYAIAQSNGATPQ